VGDSGDDRAEEERDREPVAGELGDLTGESEDPRADHHPGAERYRASGTVGVEPEASLSLGRGWTGSRVISRPVVTDVRSG